VTPERVTTLQHADAIVREEIHKAGLERELWQSFAVLAADVRSVGVMGDERTYAHPIIIRAVTSDDAMTADWARLPYDLLETMSNRIINEVAGSTGWSTTSRASRRAPSSGSERGAPLRDFCRGGSQ
jgi:GMP synthase (glutamine-hydrolysing)